MTFKLKKLYHQYEYLKLEIDEIENNIELCKDKWIDEYGDKLKDSPIFEPENEVAIQEDDEQQQSSKGKKSDKLKKLFKQLSKHLHPDKGGDAEEFKEAQRYYEDNNYFELSKMATKNGVEYDESEADISHYEETIKKMNKQLEDLRFNTIYCFYSGSDQHKQIAAQQLEKYYQIKLFE